MELAHESWASYFHSITSDVGRLFVAIESVGGRAEVEERIAAMCEGERTRHPLRVISYQPTADVIEVAVGLTVAHGPLLRNFIAAPRRVDVEEVAGGTKAILVTDAAGARTLVCVFSAGPGGARGAAPEESYQDHRRRHRPSEGQTRRPGSGRGRSRRGRGPAADAYSRPSRSTCDRLA
jgi:hypothetical protein